MSRPITLARGRFADAIILSGGQPVGVVQHTRAGWVTANAKFGLGSATEAVNDYVLEHGMKSAAWFERTTPDRRPLITGEPMPPAKTKWPKQIAGTLFPLNPDTEDALFINDINTHRHVKWDAMLRFCRERAWEAGDPVEVYTDAGLCGQNGSAPAGTWCWLALDDMGRLRDVRSGSFTPDKIRCRDVSNNAAELAAVIRAISAMPPDWTGRVNTDSKTAINWIHGEDDEFGKAPPAMIPYIGQCHAKIKKNGITFRLLKGHCSQATLDAGWHAERNLPASPWNNVCDLLCTARVIEWKLIQETFRAGT